MKNLFHIVSIVFASLLFGCVSEDDVFNEDFISSKAGVETPLIVSFLNEEYRDEIDNNPDPQNCFSILFPIEINYNTGQSISIANDDGLVQAAQSQSTTFYINSLVFPITVNTQNEQVSIKDNTDFKSLFDTCQISTLKNTLIENIGTCFDFKYPITVFNNSQAELNIENKISFIEFIENQDSDYILEFKFPFIINQDTSINSYFDLYQITNNCDRDNCPDISYTRNLISNEGATYKFTAIGATESSYSWYIDGEFIETGLQGDKNEFLTYEFSENGTYKVCVLVETPECPLGVEYCEEIIIDGIEEITCTLDFETIFIETGDTSIQKIVFEAFGSVSNSDANYFWKINDVIKDGENNTRLEYIFSDNGTYEVCIFTETPECPNGVEFCQEIIVDNIIEDTRPVFNITVSTPIQDPTNCNFNLIYDYTISDENANKYILEANAIDQNLTDSDYEWSINDTFINSGKIVDYEFTEVGEYTICVSVETPDCPNGISFCKDFKVENITVN